ncbi:iron ABC transporter permease [Pseudactinotalea sp. HY158]|uniref:ABC transporter permease n=1 Tax=Pseudactinotalea sp. HY158 TaxID=2654547 RepID=UPI00129C1452|nr:iron ABC transporter permease [Pseudactinotalea sp. HY158]QGH70682.1 ABC transporter permease subunit [Pseudactinotalea sp. HY158]
MTAAPTRTGPPAGPGQGSGQEPDRRPGRPRGFARGRLGVPAWTVAVAVPTVFLAIFFVYPAGTLIATGFVSDGHLDLGGVADVLGRSRTWRLLGLTLGQALVGTALSVALGLPGAYVLYRRRFRGQGVARALVTVPFVLPTVVVGVAFRALLAEGGPLGFLGLDGTVTAVIAALVFFNYAVVVRSVGALWQRLDPRAEQAAAALGASPWRVFRTVTLPSLVPAIASAASLVFLFCATAFGIVLVLGGPRVGTIETEIWIQTTQFLDLRAAAVLSVLQVVIVIGALIGSNVARRRREVALRLTGLTVAPRPLRWRGGDGAAIAVTAVTVAILHVLPMAHLLLASLRTPDGWGLGNYLALGGTGEHSALSVSVWQAAANSLRVAVDATLLAVTIGTLVAVVVSRSPRRPWLRRGAAGLDAAFMLPLGVSAVTVGFGFLITLNRPPLDLRESLILIPIAQAVVAIPLVVRTVAPVLRAIDPRLREAAAVLGAAPGRVLRYVDGPFLLRALGPAIGFAFAVSLGEFGATSFLSRPERPTLPVVIFRLIGRPGEQNYGMALAAAVILAILTATIMTLAERLRGEHSSDF